MKQFSDAAVALAAMSVCENLLAVLMDRNILAPEDVEEMLTDAAGAQMSEDSEVNEEAAEIIQQMLGGLVSDEEDEEGE